MRDLDGPASPPLNSLTDIHAIKDHTITASSSATRLITGGNKLIQTLFQFPQLFDFQA